MRRSFSVPAVCTAFLLCAALLKSATLDEAVSLYNQQKYAQVIELSGAVTTSSNHEAARLKFILGLSFLYLEDYSKAVSYLKESVALDGRHHSGNFYLGIAYEKLKDFRNALEQFNLYLANSKDRQFADTVLKHIEIIRIERKR